eukprot:CAMPEP_0179254814 /NCGR_PEP_ID=MMETSP0797-20121207/23429_1 /TAXON_ID=47934 /ORGANISM="Dinophysis acuminata, Strain DAEP01" /LENGTH=44 /DNA_ID= /DNA_START= /DNA_END= /DNA_ORIENTATION=
MSTSQQHGPIVQMILVLRLTLSAESGSREVICALCSSSSIGACA